MGKGMGESLDRGHVMIFSLWDDVEVNMLWLDSACPLNKPVTDPGIKRGECPGDETSTPTWLRQNYPDAYVTFKNAAVGEIDLLLALSLQLHLLLLHLRLLFHHLLHNQRLLDLDTVTTEDVMEYLWVDLGVMKPGNAVQGIVLEHGAPMAHLLLLLLHQDQLPVQPAVQPVVQHHHQLVDHVLIIQTMRSSSSLRHFLMVPRGLLSKPVNG